MDELLGLVIRDNKVVVSSRDVAASFEKKHESVLKAIKKLECDADFRAVNFDAAEYKDAQGKPRPEFLITRDGFTILAMGFTGKKAVEWKVKYIKAFNAMEEALTNPDVATTPPLPPVPKNYAEALRLAANLEEEKVKLAATNERLENEVEKTAPRAEAWERLCAADGTHSVFEVAKAFGYHPRKLFDVLREEHIFYKAGGHNYPYQVYLDRKAFVLVLTPKPIGGKTVNIPVPRVTDKGLDLIRGVLARRGIFAISA